MAVQHPKKPIIKHSCPNLCSRELEACQRVLSSGYLAAGPETRAFEKELSQRFQRIHCILVSSGWAALHLCCHVLSDSFKRVALPSYVCTALLNAVGPTHLKWRLIDNEPGGVHFDGSKVRLAEDELLIAPQMFGVVKSLSSFPKSNVIEDGAMSLGPGALQQGIASITSFYATKMITSGQGGAILTDDDNLAEACRDLIAYDNRDSYRQRFNYAPTDLCSAIGRVQLSKLDGLLQKRASLAKTYDILIKERAPEILADESGLSAKNLGLFRYWVKVSNLKDCIEQLRSKGIESKAPVFKPLHRYTSMTNDDFPEAEAAQNSVLSLPFHPGLKEADLTLIADTLAEVAIPRPQ